MTGCLSISDRHVSVLDAFKAADQVLLSGVQGITDLITTPGLINLDFADVKSVMSGAGSALMGIGSSRGDDRAVAAAEMAISSPLLEASIDGAHGVLLSIQGGSDLGLFEINEAAQLVANSAAVDANIIFGAVIDDALGDEVRVTVIAAGFDEQRPTRTAPVATSSGSSYGGSSASSAASRPSASTTWGSRPSTSSSPVTAGSAAGAGDAAGDDAASGGASGGSVAAGAGFGGGYGLDAGIGAFTSQDSQSRSPAPRGPVPSAPEATADGQVQYPAQPSAASYVPAPVAFVSGDEGEDDYSSAGKSGYDIGDSRRGGDAPAASSWPEAARTAPEKIFDVSAPRRRPVVFEEDDDLDVPDFLK